MCQSGVYMSGTRRNYSSDERPLRSRSYHFPVEEAIKSSRRLRSTIGVVNPADARCASKILFPVGHRVIVRALQIIIGHSLEIDYIVVTVACTDAARRFVEWIGQKEVRTRQHQISRHCGETIVAARTAADGSVILRQFLVPVLS